MEGEGMRVEFAPPRVRDKVVELTRNVERVIKGKREVIKLAIVTLLARGHLLIEDVPGVGKTTLAHALAQSLALKFKRIQFTSDLLPSDILGVSIYDPKNQKFLFRYGPIFSNVILADEINRATPKTQSCLLEAMNEYQVSIESRTIPLPQPFLVLATQNPMEYYGTYPLPESQLDRFLMRIRMGYPERRFEKEILTGEKSQAVVARLKPVLSGDEVIALQDMVEQVRMDDVLVDYMMNIVEKTRESDLLGVGASPRGAIHLYRAAQSLALVEGRNYAIPDDVKRLAVPVLAHRVIVEARVDPLGKRTKDTEEIIRDILKKVPVPL
jgi:MoxR-like ATPase